MFVNLYPLQKRLVEELTRQPNWNFAMVEAGTGTGKTRAYLAVGWELYRMGKADRIIVSAPTRVLQAQIVEEMRRFPHEHLTGEDRKKAAAVFGDPVLLYGQTNYISPIRLVRFYEALSEEARELFPPYDLWIKASEEGVEVTVDDRRVKFKTWGVFDLTLEAVLEAHGVPEEERDRVRGMIPAAAVCAPASVKGDKSGGHFEFYRRAREAAQDSPLRGQLRDKFYRVVVTNHYSLFSLGQAPERSRNPFLASAHPFIVLDEAHLLPEVFFTLEGGSISLAETVRLLGVLRKVVDRVLRKGKPEGAVWVARGIAPVLHSDRFEQLRQMLDEVQRLGREYLDMTPDTRLVLIEGGDIARGSFAEPRLRNLEGVLREKLIELWKLLMAHLHFLFASRGDLSVAGMLAVTSPGDDDDAQEMFYLLHDMLERWNMLVNLWQVYERAKLLGSQDFLALSAFAGDTETPPYASFSPIYAAPSICRSRYANRLQRFLDRAVQHGVKPKFLLISATLYEQPSREFVKKYEEAGKSDEQGVLARRRRSRRRKRGEEGANIVVYDGNGAANKARYLSRTMALPRLLRSAKYDLVAQGIAVLSPWAYDRKVGVFLPPVSEKGVFDWSFVSDPGLSPQEKEQCEEEMARRVAGHVESLLRVRVDGRPLGGVLVLFTSYAFLEKVLRELLRLLPPVEPGDEVLRVRTPDGERTVLAVGRGGKLYAFNDQGELDLCGPRLSHRQVKDRFVEAGNGLLLATSWAWQGLDVPGRALQGVVVTRLPYLFPYDPFFLAVESWLARTGAYRMDPERTFEKMRGALFQLQGERMFFTLRQGIGRLRRRAEDRGVVSILDDRVHSSSLKGVRRTLLFLTLGGRPLSLDEDGRIPEEFSSL
ncbi:helicase C-terminal domain-containing protein [Thermosulfurimonas sp. F29]|uniref:helicase C-terminal domain-containing protein n=1 Tax=Thermosulfurimonas sp. F29 TaxID=2867247 RepID=UPI001C82EC36|nr:helicase C-terminal domain-containing protein [Thermosulfurimonas sp. F29]MBX6424187.1 DEAD/DEAH box helicase family protein [Thermosulfurimonas sp. F29]